MATGLAAPISERRTRAATDLVRRFAHNPIFTPETLPPSAPGLVVEGVLNPGAFRYRGRVGLLMRVAERPETDAAHCSTLIRHADTGRVAPFVVSRDDPKFRQVDPRGFYYGNLTYLTTLSHFALAWSDDDGLNFSFDPADRIFPAVDAENFGIEDVRVTEIEGVYHLTYTAVSEAGVAVGYMSTRDWKAFSPRRILFPPENKDVAFFPARIGGKFWALHRPAAGEIGNGSNIWIASSPDAEHWGGHRRLLVRRADLWDSGRIGAGAAPFETPAGWLTIYHGADHQGRYCLGALLLDRQDPTRVLARSRDPVMWPTEGYELKGFYNQCVFTNGHVVDGDRMRFYYGASDRVIGGADVSIQTLLDHLGVG